MNDLIDVCRELERAQAQRRQTWLATVLRVEGSAYRRPGARMLFDSETVLAGCVSAGCLEADLLKRGAWFTRHGAKIRTYDALDDEDATTGHGCTGKLSILVEQVGEATAVCFRTLAQELATEKRAALLTVVGSAVRELPIATHLVCTADGGPQLDSSMSSAAQAVAAELLLQARCVLAEGQQRPHQIHCGGVEALVQVVEPAPHLFIFGTNHDAVPVVDLARLLGWSVSVWTPSSRTVVRERFANKARVLTLPAREVARRAERCARPLTLLMAHDYQVDLANLDILLATKVPYIGVLGPAKRTQRMLNELTERGRSLARSDLERVHGPAGLRLGAETPAEIGLAILSEAQALVARTVVASVRDYGPAILAPAQRFVPSWQASAE